MNSNSDAKQSVKNVFKKGNRPNKEEYTRFWIDMINRLEQLNRTHTVSSTCKSVDHTNR